ncbi:MAG TPA: DUF423 domain-containing protein [Opitutaceae bacterium]|nr:DUF423 domain-containing protein [Opitutaceae bacterium]
MNASSPARFALLAAGILGVTGVAAGAFGAHALAARLAELGTTHAWDTGARYQVFHAIALLATAAWLRVGSPEGDVAAKRLAWAARCWMLGAILFSGSLYGLALGGGRWLGPITPLGGAALLVGWLCVIAAACAKENGGARDEP